MVRKKYHKTNKKYYEIPAWVFIPVAIFVMSISAYAIYSNLSEPEIEITTSYEIIDPDEVVELLTNGARIIDTNPQDWYNESHIPGAINLPINVSSTCMSCWWGNLLRRVNVSDICIVYDLSGVRSEKAWLYCKQKQKPYHVYIMRGGLARWKAEEYPIEVV